MMASNAYSIVQAKLTRKHSFPKGATRAAFGQRQPPGLALALHLTISSWHRTRTQDNAPETEAPYAASREQQRTIAEQNLFNNGSIYNSGPVDLCRVDTSDSSPGSVVLRGQCSFMAAQRRSALHSLSFVQSKTAGST